MARDKRGRKLLRRYRKIDARMEQSEYWARLRSLGNQARSSVSGGSEVPNNRKADHGCEKAANENVEAIGVGAIQMLRQNDRWSTLCEFVGGVHGIDPPSA